MENDDLATLAAVVRDRATRIEVPNYNGIVAGAWMLRLFAVIAFLGALLASYLGLIATSRYMEITKNMRSYTDDWNKYRSGANTENLRVIDREHEEEIRARKWDQSEAQTGMTIGLSASATLIMAAILSLLVASVATAIRNIAQNSYRLRMEILLR
jgi:hypothetical protein